MFENPSGHSITDVNIKKLEPQDLDKFIELIRLFEDVFEMENFTMPPARHLEELLGRNDFYVFVAFVDNRIVGGLTAYMLEQYYALKPLAYIFDLAVARTYQRKRIGKKLIQAINEFCRKEGFEEVFVQADRIDAHAVDFYRSTRPSEEEDVIHFYYLLDNEKSK